MSAPPLTPRPTRLKPAGPFLRLFQWVRAPLWVKLVAGPLAITVLMVLIGVSVLGAVISVQVSGTQLVQDSFLIEQATRLQITVRGAVNYAGAIIQTPNDQNIAGYFQQRKLVLDGLTQTRQGVFGDGGVLPVGQTADLAAIERTLAEADRMVALVQDGKLDPARSLWDQQVHDLSDDAVVLADQFRQQRQTIAQNEALRALQAIWGSALVSVLLIILALVGVLAFGWLNTRLVARPVQLVARAMQRVAAGDLNVRVALAQRDELGLLEQAFNQMTGALRVLLHRAPRSPAGPDDAAAYLDEESALLRSARHAAGERTRLGTELAEAYQIQAALLPPPDQTLHGWHIEASTMPAVELGGDFYDLLNLPGGRLGVVIGDVSGHGAASALLAAWTQGMIAAVAATETEPGQVLARMNRALHGRLPRGMMVTLAYVVLDPQRGVLHFANAGHPYPLLRFAAAPTMPDLPLGVSLRTALASPLPGANGGPPPGPADWLWLDAPGVPLGLVLGARYDTARLPLAALQALCLYSDGLVEARDRAGRMFGFSRLQDTCATLPSLNGVTDDHAAAQQMVQDAVAFSADQMVADDMTVLLIRREPDAAGATGPAEMDVRYTWPTESDGRGGGALVGVGIPARDAE